jgi:tetratricopeptide (TPR) repeat protein
MHVPRTPPCYLRAQRAPTRGRARTVVPSPRKGAPTESPLSAARIAHVHFDTPPRANASGENAAARIAAVVRRAQADAPDALYNEALALAQANDLPAAASRLQMLLVLDPDDAHGRLLLARVLAAQGRGLEATSQVEMASELGLAAPDDLRASVEAAAREERQRSDEARARASAREAGELRALRAEARTLRSDALRLEAEVSEASRREARWRWMSVGMAAVSMIVLVAVAVKVRSTPTTVTTPSSESESRLSLALERGVGDRTAEILGPAPTLADRKGVALPEAPATDAADGTVPAATTDESGTGPAVTTGLDAGGGVAEGGGPPSAPATSESTPAKAPAQAEASPKTTPADTEGKQATEVAKKASKTSSVSTKATTAKSAGDSKAESVTAAPSTGPRTHVVKSGDTLGSIALKYYGKASLADRVRKANKAALKSKKGLKVGMKLTIP